MNENGLQSTQMGITYLYLVFYLTQKWASRSKYAPLSSSFSHLKFAFKEPKEKNGPLLTSRYYPLGSKIWIKITGMLLIICKHMLNEIFKDFTNTRVYTIFLSSVKSYLKFSGMNSKISYNVKHDANHFGKRSCEWPRPMASTNGLGKLI